MAKASYNRAHLLRDKLNELGFKSLNSGSFYNEFVVETPIDSEKLLSKLRENNILGGLDLGNNRLLVCCTEKNSPSDIDRYVEAVQK